MKTHDAFIWEMIEGIPQLRDTITQIEETDDTDQVVCELIEFYRGVEEMVAEAVGELQVSMSA